jgi:hypothetical protein
MKKVYQMKRKERLKISNLLRSPSAHLRERENFYISLNAYLDNYSLKESIKFDTADISSNLGVNMLFILIKLVRNESLKLPFPRDDTEFDKILKFLFQDFDLDDFDEQNSIECSIVDYINQLKEYKFYIPINYIISVLKALRAEKIHFWEYVLKKYREKKKDFDEKLFMIRKNQEKENKEIIKEFEEEFIKTGELEREFKIRFPERKLHKND